MLLYCLKCRKNTESKNPKIVRIKNGRIMLLSKCAVWESKKSKYYQRARRKKIPFSKIPLFGPLSFKGISKLKQDIKWMK